MGFQRFGIVGFGHFGQFFAASLADAGAEVLVPDADDDRLADLPAGVRAAPLAELAGTDAVVLAVPFSALDGTARSLRDHLRDGTVVMDVVSTKARATAILDEVLADHSDVLATHPLFGPPSMVRMGEGNRIVVTRRRGERADALLRHFEETYGVRIVEMPAEEHDKAMAYMQSLPFFIARALVNIDLDGLAHRETLAIPSFEKLAEIATIEEQHTVDMFDTSQISNPFAEAARAHFLDALAKLQEEIGQHEAASDDGV